MRLIPSALCIVAVLMLAGVSVYQFESVEGDLQGVHREIRAIRGELRHLQQVQIAARASGKGGRRSTLVRAPRLPQWRVGVTVQGLNYVFSPRTIAVPAGAAITWVNRTAERHTVTSVASGLFDRTVEGRARVTLVFQHVGTFRYYCSFHPYMRGLIVVHR